MAGYRTCIQGIWELVKLSCFLRSVKQHPVKLQNFAVRMKDPRQLTFTVLFILANVLALLPPVQSLGSSGLRLPPRPLDGPQVMTQNGSLQGVTERPGLWSFKGIPYAAAPLGDFRFKEPQPVKNWKGLRMADRFAPKAMQQPVFSDMRFRSNGTSEDCLYLNVWTPAGAKTKKLPVLVYFYGGGFIGGDGSEYRYDGASLAARGLVTVTVNYRLGIFGFFAHPGLSAESPHHASGNYGLLDQSAALRWVQQNIAAFGGDAQKVTIAGESAGSISVFAQMASPLSKNLIAGAIGESGGMIKPTFPTTSLHDGEQQGIAFLQHIHVKSIIDLRALDAVKLLELASQEHERLKPLVDNYFFPDVPAKIFADGRQAKVPLLVGWNSAESNYKSIINESVTVQGYIDSMQKIFSSNAAEALRQYAGTTPDQIRTSATDLASDRFIVYSTWKWADLQAKTSQQPVYRYLFSRIRLMAAERSHPKGGPRGAGHSSEIEYALGNLQTNPVYDWNQNDIKVSDFMETYFANFIKTGNPNGPGLPEWKPLDPRSSPARYLNIDVTPKMETDLKESRYHFLEKIYR